MKRLSTPAVSRTPRQLTLCFILTSTLVLSACGGGSSDSGSGGPAQPGTYRGVVTFSAKIDGQSTAESSQFVLTTTDGTNVTVDIGPNIRFQGKLNGNSFSMSQPASEFIGDYTCSGPLSVEGTITNQVNGRLLLDYTCSLTGRADERVFISAPWVAR